MEGVYIDTVMLCELEVEVDVKVEVKVIPTLKCLNVRYLDFFKIFLDPDSPRTHVDMKRSYPFNQMKIRNFRHM